MQTRTRTAGVCTLAQAEKENLRADWTQPYVAFVQTHQSNQRHFRIQPRRTEPAHHFVNAPAENRAGIRVMLGTHTHNTAHTRTYTDERSSAIRKSSSSTTVVGRPPLDLWNRLHTLGNQLTHTICVFGSLVFSKCVFPRDSTDSSQPQTVSSSDSTMRYTDRAVRELL